jgi:hypothetical protein
MAPIPLPNTTPRARRKAARAVGDSLGQLGLHFSIFVYLLAFGTAILLNYVLCAGHHHEPLFR